VSGPTTLAGINSYGQIAGTQQGSGFLWTPSSPNGATGTVNRDARLNGLAGINDFGQAIINAQPPLLFVPYAANAVGGNFFPLTGLPGSNPVLVAINSSGTILGMDSGHAFLWTPATPNGITGTAAEIPPPPGFTSMTPTALNAAGQVVGYVNRPDGDRVPFLYSGGAVYDLSTLANQSLFVIQSGINDRGEIVLTTFDSAYLLTPGAAPPPPSPGSVPVTITANAPLQAFTVAGSGCIAGGYVVPQTLNWAPGSTCTVTFVSPHSTLMGTRYVFAGWPDGVTSNPRVIVAPSQAASYSANFSLQYILIVTANPVQGGTVSGAGWYPASSTAIVTATPAPGYRFLDWTPQLFIAAGSTSANVTMNGEQSIAATFVPIAALPPGNYQITQVQLGYGLDYARPVKPINQLGQLVVSTSFVSQNLSAYLWTPEAPNSNLGYLAQIPLFSAAGINDRGQVAGVTMNGTTGQPSLWSPNTANGAIGTAVNFLGGGASDNFGVFDLNNFGQILGQLGGTGFLWTPSSPNASTGNTTTDTRFNSGVALNDFGQAITQTSLFTPSTANGATGSFTAVPGLPGAASTQLQDINNNGTILGSSCMPSGTASQCNNHMFLWTPASPNGTTGATAEIPMPPGFASMFPSALNTNGQIVGGMRPAGGSPAPFLYTGGAVYDLSTLGLSNTAVGINDRGQIVVTDSYSVFLLTPSQSPAPAPVAVLPAAGSGPSQTMTFTFKDPRGWQDLDVVNILINSFLDGRNSCYLAYSRPQSTLYLVNDAGTALVAGGTANSQCAVTLSGTATGTGNTLTLTLNMTFASTFAGNKVIYMAARDVAQNNSGWQALGTWGVPGAVVTPLAAVGVNPPSGANSNPTLTFTFTDAQGFQDLGVVNILINNFLDGRNACYVAYSRPLNLLYLVSDNGSTLLPGLTLNGPGTAANSQCAVYAAASSVATSGNTFSLVLSMAFSDAFAGNHVIYLAARDNGDHNTSGWQALGSWTVP